MCEFMYQKAWLACINLVRAIRKEEGFLYNKNEKSASVASIAGVAGARNNPNMIVSLKDKEIGEIQQQNTAN